MSKASIAESRKHGRWCLYIRRPVHDFISNASCGSRSTAPHMFAPSSAPCTQFLPDYPETSILRPFGIIPAAPTEPYDPRPMEPIISKHFKCYALLYSSELLQSSWADICRNLEPLSETHSTPPLVPVSDRTVNRQAIRYQRLQKHSNIEKKYLLQLFPSAACISLQPSFTGKNEIRISSVRSLCIFSPETVSDRSSGRISVSWISLLLSIHMYIRML